MKKKNLSEIVAKRKKYVYDNLSKATKGKHITNRQRSKIFKKLWKEAKKKYK